MPAPKQFNPLIIKLMFYVISGILLTPSYLLAGDVITTYDKKTIWYPSMYVGRIWARSGEAKPPSLEGEKGRISTEAKEKSSSSIKADPSIKGAAVDKSSSTAITQGAPVVTTESVRSSEIKKKLKQKRLKTIQAMKKERRKKQLRINYHPRSPPIKKIRMQPRSKQYSR